MEHIEEILKRVQTNSSSKKTGKSSNAEVEDDLEAPVCAVCKGARFVHPRLPSGKTDYGHVVPCLCTRNDADVDRAFTWASQFNKQKEMTFESFDWKRDNLSAEQRDNLDNAYHLAFEFAKSPEGWLVFRGDNGCGKTHLAAAIVNYRYKMKQPALFIVVSDFLDHLRSTFKPDSETSYDQLFDSVKNAPLLILDDFGKHSSTPWAQEKLFQVINYRYNAKLPTVITTNLEEEDMDNSILSRFADPTVSTPFHVTAPSYFSGRHSLKRAPRGGQRGR